MFWGSKLFASVLSLIVESAEKCVKKCGGTGNYKVSRHGRTNAAGAAAMGASGYRSGAEIFDGQRCPTMFRPTGSTSPHARSAREPQSRATRRRHAAARVRADPRRRRQRQDARADHAHRVADRDRPGVARWRSSAVTFTNKAAQEMLTRLSAHAADQHARHVDRHVPRPVQPHAARALPRRRPAAALPDPRHAGPARADQAPDARRTNIDDETLSAAADLQ